MSEKQNTQEQVTIFDSWTPKTEIGKAVKEGRITDIDEIISQGKRILEPEIVDALLPNLETDLLLIGQSKGKFGGGARRVFKQTQKKTREGNKPKFSTFAVVGNRNGYVGIGYGKAKETVPAREKALRNAKLNLIKIARGCGSWECACDGPHTVPFRVDGKCGSATMTLLPAPKGKGLIVEKECKKILDLAGIKDVWSKGRGQTKTKTNLIIACMYALRKTISTKVSNSTIVEGKLPEDLKEGLEEE
ncbi:MAG: 30S ribosomal protein S5 [Candidatus Woesearchaeota archaeon]